MTVGAGAVDPKRVLIVEPDSAFALSLASVYRDEGLTTAVAGSAVEAERELQARVADLVVVRAELPDLSGFSLCGRLRKERPGLPVVLFSSESSPEALSEHARTPAAADAYLAMPLDTAALARISRDLLAAPVPVEVADDAFLEEVAPVEVRIGEAPPPRPAGAPAAPAPPPMPRRARRSAITDEDRVFAERAFQSIADRRTALVAESHRRRPPPPRQLLATPEGKLALLREELKAREAQIARLSEIWEAREQELSHVDDRLHDKEVEIQALKLQVDELLRRLDSARDQVLERERQHGASIEGLLLEKFSQEKDLIEVVAAKERRINELEREVRLRDDDLAKRKVALDAAVDEIGRLERLVEGEREQAERRERELRAQLGARETEMGAAQKALAEGRARAAEQEAAARLELQRLGAVLAGVEAELASAREREAATAERARESEARASDLAAEMDREREAAREAVAALQARIDEREQAIREREERIGRLEEEGRRQREAARAREEDLAREIKDHLVQIASQEREAEEAAAEAVEREAELKVDLERKEGELRAAEAAREADQAAFAQRAREQEGRLAAAEQRLAEDRRRAQEEIQRRDHARAQDAQRYQAVVQDAARRIEALQRELVRRGGAGAAAGPPAPQEGPGRAEAAPAAAAAPAEPKPDAE